jgi:hypothetical protein
VGVEASQQEVTGNPLVTEDGGARERGVRRSLRTEHTAKTSVIRKNEELIPR